MAAFSYVALNAEHNADETMTPGDVRDEAHLARLKTQMQQLTAGDSQVSRHTELPSSIQLSNL